MPRQHRRAARDAGGLQRVGQRCLGGRLGEIPGSPGEMVRFRMSLEMVPFINCHWISLGVSYTMVNSNAVNYDYTHLRYLGLSSWPWSAPKLRQGVPYGELNSWMAKVLLGTTMATHTTVTMPLTS